MVLPRAVLASPPSREKNSHSVPVGTEWSEETGFKLRRGHITSVDPDACTQLYGQPKPLCDALPSHYEQVRLLTCS